MEPIMTFWTKTKWRKWLRSLHRDLGYFFAGLTCIYALSGILLNEKIEGNDPAYAEIEIQKNLDKPYSLEELKSNWTVIFPEGPVLTHILPSENDFMIYVKGGEGLYVIDKSQINIRIYKERKFIKFINDIHYNQGKRFSWMAHLFAVILLFFAISGLFLVKGKNGLAKRGIWLLIGGVLLPIIVYYL